MAKPGKPPASINTSPVSKLPVTGDPVQAIGDLMPWRVFEKALIAVPALKYALGVLGIISAIAIVKLFGIDFLTAVLGTIVMVVLMVVLLVFAALTKVRSPHIRRAAHVLMWSFLLLTILSATLLFTSVWFNFPKPPAELLGHATTIAESPASTDPRMISDGGSILSKPQDGVPKVTMEEVKKPEHGVSVPPEN